MARNREELEDVGRPRNGEHKLSPRERALLDALGKGHTLGAEDDPARQKFPELWKWLTETDLPDNRVKEPATLIIRVGPEGVSATVNDRALGWSVDASSEFLENIFAELEIACNDSTKCRKSHNKDPKIRKRKNLP